MEFHPLANIFPLMQGAEFDALVADIQDTGLREPIVVLDGKILDGRNRWRACEAAGVAQSYTAYKGDDPIRYVVSLNLRRRHLDESQRAMVAARLATLPDGVRTDRQGAQICAPSQPDAADLLNVSRRSVQTARTVQAKGTPSLVAAVDAGQVSVSAAAAVATFPPEQQDTIVDAGPAAIIESAKAIHNHRAQGSGKNEWYTPVEFVRAVREFMGGIDLDPASSEFAQHHHVQAVRFFSVEDDGLSQDWGGRVWLNPPYSQPAIAKFCEKMIAEWKSGRVTEAIVLTHNYTDTAWFHAIASVCHAICFTRGRINFVNAEGKRAAPTQGQAFLYFGKRPKSFAKAFENLGFVVSRV